MPVEFAAKAINITKKLPPPVNSILKIGSYRLLESKTDFVIQFKKESRITKKCQFYLKNKSGH